ncbi:unnamed protein product [Caenorhabditis angaria]|uniref:Uncharacterized protein n=1 Tax=Caenorhabditis angaria TaxID=860376 RepID=A0A9P1IY04_9PELO|nr:unnamed protein product [Caenorhabditis angaria]
MLDIRLLIGANMRRIKRSALNELIDNITTTKEWSPETSSAFSRHPKTLNSIQKKTSQFSKTISTIHIGSIQLFQDFRVLIQKLNNINNSHWFHSIVPRFSSFDSKIEQYQQFTLVPFNCSKIFEFLIQKLNNINNSHWFHSIVPRFSSFDSKIEQYQQFTLVPFNCSKIFEF